MTKKQDDISYFTDGSIDTSAWISFIKEKHKLVDVSLFEACCLLLQASPYLEKALEIADIILDLHLDQETAAAGMMSFAPLQLHPSPLVYTLATSVQQLNIPIFKKAPRTQTQMDNVRKMLLGMAKDIRVVIIKLAERLQLMRSLKSFPPEERRLYAQEILDIYAPLANRLGIGQLKWELEDLAFRYLDPDAYKKIATFLAERRIDREKHIQQLIYFLQEKLSDAKLLTKITGRAKHIYSIYRKTTRKDLDLNNIFDNSAIRILVHSIEDCYTALSIVHSLWPPIMDEFDDYIAHPKSNGYRSIHTAVIGENGKHFEIQIRTHEMHEEAERGIAAHWMYKENAQHPLTEADKITYLRQLLSWHQDIAKQATCAKTLQSSTIIDDEVYVVTPAGDIINLPQGATPLDFAYHIHTELGHHCRGAKINGHIAPLTYVLQTGDAVDIITTLHGGPSRDWLNPEAGYVKTSRARNKIAHWFKQITLSADIMAGKQLLERELARHGLGKYAALSQIARHFHYKNEDALFVALNRGSIRIGQIIQSIQHKTEEKIQAPSPLPTLFTAKEKNHHTAIIGAKDLLTRFAKCCKPIPGDAIIGYITQGRGISIHKNNCKNVRHFSETERFIVINWDNNYHEMFNTDLKITTLNDNKALNDLIALFANEKIPLTHFQSTCDKYHNQLFIIATVQIENGEQLQRLLHKVQQLPSVLEVMRVKIE